MQRNTLFILSCLLAFSTFTLHAQRSTYPSSYTTPEETYNTRQNDPGNGKTVTLPHADDCPTCPTKSVPFDGGFSLIIAAGVGYGLKRANDRRKIAKDKSLK